MTIGKYSIIYMSKQQSSCMTSSARSFKVKVAKLQRRVGLMSPIHNGEHDDMRIGDTLERRAELGCFVLTRDDKSRGYSKPVAFPCTLREG